MVECKAMRGTGRDKKSAAETNRRLARAGNESATAAAGGIFISSAPPASLDP